MGIITGLGRVNFLSGQIWLNGSGFDSATWCAPVSPLGCNAGRLGCTVDSAQMPILNKKSFFFFKSVLQITNQFEFKSKLNFNDFYSHNKIQEHFITPRKNMEWHESNK
jgi:hypothetical protein